MLEIIEIKWGTLKEIDSNVKTYEWIIDETTYNLIYDNKGNLYGVYSDDLNSKELEEVFLNLFEFDFPLTFIDYLSLEVSVNDYKISWGDLDDKEKNILLSAVNISDNIFKFGENLFIKGLDDKNIFYSMK